MKLKTRLTILFFCTLVFLVAAPAIVFYSLGYRINLATLKIVATGGIYVKASPTGADISIDRASGTVTGFFNNSVFVQNLHPGLHQVDIAKEGYYPYQKKLEVKEKEVTKLENVTLFKTDMGFIEAESKVSFLSASKDRSSLLAAVQTKTGYDLEVIDVSTLQKNIFTLATNATITGAAWSSDAKKVLLTVDKTYYLVDTASLAGVATLLPAEEYDPKAWVAQTEGLAISPNGQKTAYITQTQVLISKKDAGLPALAIPGQEQLVSLFSGKVTGAEWLNDDYVAIATPGAVVISEIDLRQNVNVITLPYVTPQLFFSPAANRLFVLSQKTLFASGPVLP